MPWPLESQKLRECSEENIQSSCPGVTLPCTPIYITAGISIPDENCNSFHRFLLQYIFNILSTLKENWVFGKQIKENLKLCQCCWYFLAGHKNIFTAEKNQNKIPKSLLVTKLRGNKKSKTSGVFILKITASFFVSEQKSQNHTDWRRPPEVKCSLLPKAGPEVFAQDLVQSNLSIFKNQALKNPSGGFHHPYRRGKTKQNTETHKPNKKKLTKKPTTATKKQTTFFLF